MLSFERTCQPGLVYGRAGGQELTLDLYLPELPTDHPRPIPAVVYIHGGGWVRGSRGSPSGVTFALEMASEGLAVACVNYRLAPAHPAPAAIEDAKLAVRWVRENAGTHGMDPRRIVAMGNSAGGHLAAMLAVTRPEDGFEGSGLTHLPSRVMGAVDLCGIADVAELLAGPEERIWAQAWIPPETPERMNFARRCSPIHCIHSQIPPILIIHGNADDAVPYSQSVRFHQVLRAVGTDTELVTIEGSGHMLSIAGPPAVQRQVREARRRFFKKLGLIADSQP
ncbi:alpha/beta hydrolase [Candidatus Sumerlaeota bacterium]|nr:alpha/beta hydrolase [Candidatus Sumerlaeota bacterium]